jgi:hypothetical protein
MKKDRLTRRYAWRMIVFTARVWLDCLRTLPEVWIPPAELRDQRELPRLRILLVHLRTRVKNRIYGTLARHNVQIPGAALFGVADMLFIGNNRRAGNGGGSGEWSDGPS